MTKQPPVYSMAKKLRKGQDRLLSPQGMLGVLVLIVLTVVGLAGLLSVEKLSKAALASKLETVLNANVEALRIWIEDEKKFVKTWAENREVREAILKLVKPQNTSQEEVTHSSSPEFLERLRKILGPVCKVKNYFGFVVFDVSGLQVGALLEEPVGKRELIGTSDFVQRTLKGESVVSLPFPGEIPLPDLQGNFKTGQPIIFSSTPVYDYKKNIVAVLAFRIRPEMEFTRVLEISRPDKSGETYAFNSDGLMISDSRFNLQLKQAGLIPDKADSRAMLNIEALDPGSNLLEGYKPKLPKNLQPFTRMAESAIKGESGLDLDGYNSYRGVPVVGAWKWLPKYGFGVATEMEVEETLIPSQNMRKLFMLLFSLLTLATIFSLFLQGRRTRIRKARVRTKKTLRKTEAINQAVFSNASNAILTIDENSVIQSFNSAAEKLFGYRADEAQGKNVSLLFPSEHRARQLAGLKDYLVSGRPKILGKTMETMGLRKDDSSFPMDLSLSEIWVGQQRMFIAIVRDISRRKNAEEQMRLRTLQQEVIANIGQSALAGVDLPELRDKAVKRVQETLGVDFISILSFQHGERRPSLASRLWMERGVSGKGAFKRRKKFLRGLYLALQRFKRHYSGKRKAFWYS